LSNEDVYILYHVSYSFFDRMGHPDVKLDNSVLIFFITIILGKSGIQGLKWILQDAECERVCVLNTLA
jgi:hypothetical protein